MPITSPEILELMNARHELFKPGLLLGRSQRVEKDHSEWNQSRYSTRHTTNHEHTDAQQNELNEED